MCSFTACIQFYITQTFRCKLSHCKVRSRLFACYKVYNFKFLHLRHGYSIKCVPYSLSCYVQSVLVCHNHILKCLLQLSVVKKLSLVNMCGLDVSYHFLVVLHHLCSHCALYFLILMFLQLRFIASLFILLK